MSRKSFFTNLDGPANAVTISKEGNQVAVAGRNVFKIYDIDDESRAFVESINLRVGKNLNLNFSCNDVAWNLTDENVLATGATNGAVVTWNLQKTSRSKMDIIYSNHKRTVNKVCFHPTDPSLLMTGSQDGTMILFDVRKRPENKEGVTTFHSSSESVRDVQFCPHQYNQFASVQENGNVQTWDFRRPDRVERQFTAHNGPVFACDWHPEEKRWLATAGRDKSIKVWDVSGKTVCEYQVNTIASVARIKWRPNRRYCIASSSLVVDFSLNVWDIRRPFIPYAVFATHKDVTTGFAWRGDEKTLISAGKDNTLYQNVFDDALRPANHANPMGLHINNHGDITVAISDNILNQSTSALSGAAAASQAKEANYETKSNPSPTNSTNVSISTHTMGSSDRTGGNLLNSLFSLAPNTSFRDNISGKLSSMFRDKKQLGALGEQFKDCTSTLRHYKNQNADKALSMDWFVISALRYQLTGKPFPELCSHNAEVAYHLDRPQVAQTWKMLSQLYSVVSQPRMSQYSGGSFVNVTDASGNELKEPGDRGAVSRHASGSMNGAASVRHYSGTSRTMATQTQVIFNGDEAETEAGAGLTDTEDESDQVINDGLIVSDMLDMVENPFKASKETDFFFGDGDAALPSLTLGLELAPSLLGLGDEAMSMDGEAEELEELPREAFNLRHVIPPFSVPFWWQGETVDVGCESPHGLDEESHDMEDSVAEDGGYVSASATNDIDALCQSLLSSYTPTPQQFDVNQIVVDMLHFLASQGDIQTCVSALLILGDRLKFNSIDSVLLEFWYTSYIELLTRFQLWNVSNQVIRLSPLANIHQLNQTSTTLKVNCGICGKLNGGSSAWACNRCRTTSSQCSVCHLPVTGLYVWCQGCSHGGHLKHIQEWMTLNRYCPTGCGHQCEFT